MTLMNDREFAAFEYAELDAYSEAMRDGSEGYGDARRCRVHPNVKISSDDGMFDGPCGQCEYEMDQPEPEPQPDDPKITHAVTARVGKDENWAIYVFTCFKGANSYAKDATKANYKNVKVVRLNTNQEKCNAEFQVAKFEDWASDGGE